MSTVTGQPVRIPIVLAERIIVLLEESGASEAEKHVALEIAKAMVPVLPHASCSVEQNDNRED